VSGQRWSATVLATVVAASVLVLALVVGSWATAVSVRRAATSAADLAALAGAQALVRGQPVCARVDRFARANDAVLVLCRVEGQRVRAVVEVSTTLVVLGRRMPVRSQGAAWAGPVTDGIRPAAG
jgi:secretion/DNA translocation related TadE-like protein